MPDIPEITIKPIRLAI